MKALLQKWLVFGRSQVKKALKSLEFNYSQIEGHDCTKSYFSESLKKQKELMAGKPMGKFSRTFFWKAVKNNWQRISEQQKALTKQKNSIVRALIFWQFARTVIRDENLSAEEKREFLKSFFQDPNKYIQIISILECLPDVVFKKVLWRGNIDFPSFEAFLRRLNPEQEDLIKKTYHEFFVLPLFPHSFPTVYKNSVRDFFRFCFHLTSTEKEKNSEYGDYNRWQTKSAWAFNLLGLDFGFGLYSKGINDDTKITNKKFSRFLSIKNHINDFVVNQFDGLYWWFYKTARSNYVFRPNKTVTLKDHICPGFWMTLILHTVFWVVSPIVFGFTFTHWMKNGHYSHLSHSWPVLVSLIPTPLFVLLAAMKLIIRSIEKHGGLVGKLITKIGTFVGNWFRGHPKFVGALQSLGIGVVVCIAGAFILAVISILMYLVWYVSTIIQLPMSTKVLISATVLFHLVFSFLRKLKIDNWDYSRYMPRWIKVASLFSILLVVVNLYDQYAAKEFQAFIMNAINLFQDKPLTASLMIIGSILFILSFKVLGASTSNEEKFARKSKSIRYLTISGALVVLWMFYLAHTREEKLVGMYSDSLISLIASIVTMFALFGTLLVLMVTGSINEHTFATRNASRKTIETYYELYEDKWSFSKSKFKYEPKLKFKRLLKNKWLLNLDSDLRVKVIERIGRTVETLFEPFPWGDKEVIMNRFINQHLPIMDKGNFQVIRKITGQIVGYRKWEGKSSLHSPKLLFIRALDDDDLNFIITRVLKGDSFVSVVNAVKVNKEQRYARRTKWAKYKDNFSKIVVEPIAWFFKTITKPFIYCGRKIRQFFATIKDLVELFNERCPYVSRSKTLE